MRPPRVSRAARLPRGGGCARVRRLDAGCERVQPMTVGVGHTGLAQAAEFALLSRRNDSLPPGARFLVFVFLFVVSVGIAAAFAAFGAWPILPFAGLEMLALWLAFDCVARHAGDYERIVVEGDRVTVERCEKGRVFRREFNRCWAQVVVSPDGARVALRSHGRETEIGRHASTGERLLLARSLRRHGLRAG